jgi:hypothetical protein
VCKHLVPRHLSLCRTLQLTRLNSTNFNHLGTFPITTLRPKGCAFFQNSPTATGHPSRVMYDVVTRFASFFSLTYMCHFTLTSLSPPLTSTPPPSLPHLKIEGIFIFTCAHTGSKRDVISHVVAQPCLRASRRLSASVSIPIFTQPYTKLQPAPTDCRHHPPSLTFFQPGQHSSGSATTP